MISWILLSNRGARFKRVWENSEALIYLSNQTQKVHSRAKVRRRWRSSSLWPRRRWLIFSRRIQLPSWRTQFMFSMTQGVPVATDLSSFALVIKILKAKWYLRFLTHASKKSFRPIWLSWSSKTESLMELTHLHSTLSAPLSQLLQLWPSQFTLDSLLSNLILKKMSTRPSSTSFGAPQSAETRFSTRPFWTCRISKPSLTQTLTSRLDKQLLTLRFTFCLASTSQNISAASPKWRSV